MEESAEDDNSVASDDDDHKDQPSIDEVSDDESDSYPSTTTTTETRHPKFTREQLAEAKQILEASSEEKGTHRLWKDDITYNRLPIIRLFGRAYRAGRWWTLVTCGATRVNEEEYESNRCWKPICGDTRCIIHYVKCSRSIKTPSEMTDGDRFLAHQRLERMSRVMIKVPRNAYEAQLKNPCRTWVAAMGPFGKGDATFFGRHISASKAAWMIHNNCEVPQGLQVCHKCSVFDCIEAEHLELGTASKNMGADKRRDGTLPQGETHHCATITNALARDIALSLGDGRTVAQRADDYHVNKHLVYSIDHGHAWRSVLSNEEHKEREAKLDKNRRRVSRCRGFSAKEIREIRRRIKCGEQTPAECATAYQTDIDRIIKISQRTIYKHIQDTEEEQKQMKIKNHQKRLRRNSQVVHEDNGDEHWRWQRQVDDGGYGQTRFHGRGIMAHRLSYIVFKNGGASIPKHIFVRHRNCPYRDCINPACLVLGDAADNARDKITDGTSLRGEANPRAKMTEAMARKLIKNKGKGTIKQRAARLGVSYSSVHHIDMEQSWKWLREQIEREEKEKEEEIADGTVSR